MIQVRDSMRGRVGIACSGGTDSTALVVLVADVCREVDGVPPVVIHVDHGTRQDSADDALFVTRLAEDHDLAFLGAEVCWHSQSLRRREHELRVGRYDALARAAHSLDLDAIVTAHTFDDQVETILMRLLSGTGGTAGAGMSVVSVLDTAVGPLEIRRPLLDVSRSVLDEVVKGAGLVALDDPSNHDRGYRRNALRHDILPRLRDVFPGFERALVRSASLGYQDSSALDDIAEEIASRVVRTTREGVSLDRGSVRDAHPAIANRLIRCAFVAIMGSTHRDLSRERIESVVRAASGRTGAVIELPGGIQARVLRTAVLFTRGSNVRDDVEPDR